MKAKLLVLSCEHAVNTVPSIYQKYFNGNEALLDTHRAIDFGALTIANYLSNFFGCELIQARATRLLIDCNRRLSNPNCFSEITASLPKAEKQAIIQEYYTPFREQVVNLVKHHIRRGYQVWHLSIHSFTPIMNNLVRNADVSFLYDPRRSPEKNLAKQWQLAFKQQVKDLRVRLNYPYRGVTDGFTSFLRTQFNEDKYLGLEIESNQALMRDNQSVAYVAKALATTLKSVYVR
ncbi:N-formylglutamate amidohydrolase [Legionella brunensis]|uniref:N-formylglutamate amidohydrolase n=1 Tax=Legionella brunensis TaxID=29422 RepID=A0A0W0S3F3_9GAMM|nr:N-formylglutamate amidohydrolase [Legionella brunensis]KTC77874.1 N-formylglutamate amidohydrolase [Legionella brunensis]